MRFGYFFGQSLFSYSIFASEKAINYMIMRKKIFAAAAVIFALISTASYGQEPVRLTLKECLEYALEQNYSKQSVVLNEEAQESSVNQSQNERWPSVTASVGENYSYTLGDGNSWSGSYSLSSSVTLYQGGQINNTIKQSKLQLERTRLQTQQYDNELIIQVLQSFLSAIGNEELLKYQQAVLAASKQQAEEGRVKFEAGQIIESDYLLLNAQYATDLDNVTATKIARDNNLVALKNLMAIPLTLVVELVYPDDSVVDAMLSMPTLEEVLERGMDTMPEIKISDYNVNIAQMELRISKSAYYPTISATVSVGSGHSPDFKNYGTQVNDRFGPTAGVSLSIPIFNNGRTKNDVNQSRIAVQQAELERKQSVNDIQQTLISEYNNVVTSGSKYYTSEIKRDAYKSSFDAYTEMFRAGSITTVELLQQQNNYISTINDYIQDKYTFILQRKVLDVYMGEPIVM